MTTAVETAQAKRMPEQPAPMPLPARTGASVAYANPYSARLAARSGVLRGHTSGLCDGYVQANIVMLRDTWANEFLRFCQLNPKPCPLLDVTEPGVPVFRHLGQDVDVRRDVPRSVHHCLWMLDLSMRELSDIYGTRGEADRLAGELHARLRYARIDQVFEIGLHKFLGGVRDDIATLSDEIGRQFLLD